MVVMVTGSRNWDLVLPIEKSLYWYTRGWDEVTLLEGGAKGADTIARNYALSRGWEISTFLPHYDKHGANAPHVRNSDMIAMRPDLVLAFVRNKSAGTMSTIVKAFKAGLLTRISYYEDYA